MQKLLAEDTCKRQDRWQSLPPCRDRIGHKAMTAQTLSRPGSAATAGNGMGGHWLAPVLEMAALATGPARCGWTCHPRIATRTPGTDASCVGVARDFTIATLRRWKVAERGDDIVTVVSELLTNALRHTLPDRSGSRWPIRLGLLQPGHCVLCAVADPSWKAPVRREPSYFAESGRGLHVVSGLSDMWGFTTPSDTGKAVWAMFLTTP